MRARYTQSFKRQAVEKALSRADGTTLAEVTDSLGVGYSTLNKWMVNSRNQQLGTSSEHDNASIGGVRKEKRLALPRFGRHLKRGDYGLRGDNHESKTTKIHRRIQA